MVFGTSRHHRTGCHSYWWWCLVDDLVLAAITFHRASFYHVCGVEYHRHKKCGSATVGVAKCGHKPNILPAFKKKAIHQTNDWFIRVIHEAMFSSRNCSFCLGVKLVINWTRCTARVVFLKYMTNMRLFQGNFFLPWCVGIGTREGEHASAMLLLYCNDNKHPFCNVTIRLSGSQYVTPGMFSHNFISIHDKLQTFSKNIPHLEYVTYEKEIW